jgi:hypothetical protein
MWSKEYIIGCVTLFFLAFSVVSRSRNRNNLKYHLVAAFSNVLYHSAKERG